MGYVIRENTPGVMGGGGKKKGNNWHKDPESIKEGKGGKKKNAEQKPRKAEKS